MKSYKMEDLFGAMIKDLLDPEKREERRKKAEQEEEQQKQIEDYGL